MQKTESIDYWPISPAPEQYVMDEQNESIAAKVSRESGVGNLDASPTQVHGSVARSGIKPRELINELKEYYEQ